MDKIFIPTLSHWLNKNIWSGSLQKGSYYLTPQGEADGVPTEVRAQTWAGPLCYELAEPEGEAVFPLTQAGLAELEGWLEGEMDRLNGGEA